MTTIEYKGYRIEVSSVGKGWRASIFSSGSPRALAESPLYGAFLVKRFKQGSASFFLRQFFLFDLKVRFFVPIRTSLTPARPSAGKVRRRINLSYSALARLNLDGFEHDATAGCGRDDDQRGARLRARFESRHNLVSGRSKDLNHDAVMRIGSEAPKRRTHSSNRHESQGACRDSATSNHHRRPVTSERTRPKPSRCLQHPPFIVPDAKRRRPVQCPPERAATGRSEACAPRPRSWSCERRGCSRYGLETTAPRRCSSGT